MEIQLLKPEIHHIEDMVQAALAFSKDDAKWEGLINEREYRRIALHFVNNASASWVAEVDGEFAGFLLGFISPSQYNPSQKALYEYLFYIKPEYRKTNLASKFLETFEEYGRRMKCNYIQFCRMKGGINMEKRGFREVSTTYVKEL